MGTFLSAARRKVFLQCVQLRDVAFQRHDRSGGAFRQGCYQFFEIHVRRSLMEISVGGLSFRICADHNPLRE